MVTPPAFPNKPRRPSAVKRSSVNYSLPISPALPATQSPSLDDFQFVTPPTSPPAPQSRRTSTIQTPTQTTTPRRASVSQNQAQSTVANRRLSVSEAQALFSSQRRASIQAQNLVQNVTTRRASIIQGQGLHQGLSPAPRRATVSQGQPTVRRPSVSQFQPVAARRGSTAWAPLAPNSGTSSATLSVPNTPSRLNSKRNSLWAPLETSPEASQSAINTARTAIAPLNTTTLIVTDEDPVPPSPSRNWAPLSSSFDIIKCNSPSSSPTKRTWGPLPTPPEGSKRLSIPPSPGSPSSPTTPTWGPLATPIDGSNAIPSPTREYGQGRSSKRVSTMPIGINYSLPNSPAKSAFSAETKDNKASEVSSFSPYESTIDQLASAGSSDKEKVNELPYDGSDTTGKRSRRRFGGKRKWILLAAILLVLVLGGAGAGVFLFMTHKKKSDNGGSGGVAGVVQSDPNDPSIFTKDPNLHQSFYGMAYTPQNARYPSCEDGLDAVIEDIQLISQLTTRLRIYGSDCNQASLVLEAIQKTKVNMTVWLTAWLPQVNDDPKNEIFNRQVSGVVDAIKQFGTDNIGGILVGNEFLMNGGTETVLIAKMAQMRNTIASLNLKKKIPVGTADTGAAITSTLSQGSEVILANIHSWFAGVTVETAADWVHNFASTGQPSSVAQATNQPDFFIGETGWPSAANDTAFSTNNMAVAGIPQLNTFLDTFVCQSNQNITNGDRFSKYFYFEAFDEPWKESLGSVEPYWGIFNSNKTLKEGIVLPDCSHS